MGGNEAHRLMTFSSRLALNEDEQGLPLLGGSASRGSQREQSCPALPNIRCPLPASLRGLDATGEAREANPTVGVSGAAREGGISGSSPGFPLQTFG